MIEENSEKKDHLRGEVLKEEIGHSVGAGGLLGATRRITSATSSADVSSLALLLRTVISNFKMHSKRLLCSLYLYLFCCY